MSSGLFKSVMKKMCLQIIQSLKYVHKNEFGIKQPTMVDMP